VVNVKTLLPDCISVSSMFTVLEKYTVTIWGSEFQCHISLTSVHLMWYLSANLTALQLTVFFCSFSEEARSRGGLSQISRLGNCLAIWNSLVLSERKVICLAYQYFFSLFSPFLLASSLQCRRQSVVFASHHHAACLLDTRLPYIRVTVT